jgi:Zn finger protein HypA/HybF involved in hydrogenase expression
MTRYRLARKETTMAKKKEPTIAMICNECAKKFKRTLANAHTTLCPHCHGADVDPIEVY